MQTPIDLCIIGFGISGIATTRWAQEAGLRFVTLEKETGYGGVWRTKSYSGVMLQTTKHSYAFSDMPMREEVALHPSDKDLMAYFRDYIGHHNLESHVRYRHEVVSLPHRTGDYHRVIYRDLLAGDLHTLEARHLAICSGFYTSPKWAPGVDFTPFQGDRLHAADFSETAPKQGGHYDFRGKRVLVIGNGPSGCDLAMRAVDGGAAAVDLSYRSPRWIFTRYCGLIGLNFFSNRLFLWIATRLPVTLFVTVLYIIFYIPYYLSGASRELTLPGGVVNRNNLTLNEDFMIYLNQGRFRYLQSPQLDFEENAVTYHLEKPNAYGQYHETQPLDIVISATGYEVGVPFLGLEEIPKLYRRCQVVNDPTVAFIGFAPSFNWIQVADLQARWFIGSFTGRHTLPPQEERETELQGELEANEALPYEYQDLAYLAYIYCDRLVEDMGIRKNTHWTRWWSIPRYDEWAD